MTTELKIYTLWWKDIDEFVKERIKEHFFIKDKVCIPTQEYIGFEEQRKVNYNKILQDIKSFDYSSILFGLSQLIDRCETSTKRIVHQLHTCAPTKLNDWQKLLDKLSAQAYSGSDSHILIHDMDSEFNNLQAIQYGGLSTGCYLHNCKLKLEEQRKPEGNTDDYLYHLCNTLLETFKTVKIPQGKKPIVPPENKSETSSSEVKPKQPKH